FLDAFARGHVPDKEPAVPMEKMITGIERIDAPIKQLSVRREGELVDWIGVAFQFTHSLTGLGIHERDSNHRRSDTKGPPNRGDQFAVARHRQRMVRELAAVRRIEDDQFHPRSAYAHGLQVRAVL